MEWNIDRRLAIAGLFGGVAVGLIGAGITILFPEVKGLGWACLFAGCAVLLLWLIFEIKQWMRRTRLSMVTAIVIGSVIGGGLAFLFWKTGITVRESHETVQANHDTNAHSTAPVNVPSDPPKALVAHPAHPRERPHEALPKPEPSTGPDIAASIVNPESMAIEYINNGGGVEHWPGRCGPSSCGGTSDSMLNTCDAVCTPPPPDKCADDMHVVTEREWQELMARLKELEKSECRHWDCSAGLTKCICKEKE